MESFCSIARAATMELACRKKRSKTLTKNLRIFMGRVTLLGTKFHAVMLVEIPEEETEIPASPLTIALISQKAKSYKNMLKD